MHFLRLNVYQNWQTAHFAYSASFVIVDVFSILSPVPTTDIAGVDGLAFRDISALSFRSVKPGVCNFL